MTTPAGYHKPSLSGVHGAGTTTLSEGFSLRSWQFRTGLLIIGGILAVTDACVMSAIYLLAFFTGQKEVLLTMNAVGEFWYELPLVVLAVPMVLYLAVSGLILGIRARDAAAERDGNVEFDYRSPAVGMGSVPAGRGEYRYSMAQLPLARQTVAAPGETTRTPRPFRQQTLALVGHTHEPTAVAGAFRREPDAAPAVSEFRATRDLRGF